MRRTSQTLHGVWRFERPEARERKVASLDGAPPSRPRPVGLWVAKGMGLPARLHRGGSSELPEPLGAASRHDRVPRRCTLVYLSGLNPASVGAPRTRFGFGNVMLARLQQESGAGSLPNSTMDPLSMGVGPMHRQSFLAGLAHEAPAIRDRDTPRQPQRGTLHTWPRMGRNRVRDHDGNAQG